MEGTPGKMIPTEGIILMPDPPADTIPLLPNCSTPSNSKDTTIKDSFTLNQGKAIQKKYKSCNAPPLRISMLEGNNLRIWANPIVFEKLRIYIQETLKASSNIELAITHKSDKDGTVIHQDIMRVMDITRTPPIQAFTVNVYRTQSSFLINGPQTNIFRSNFQKRIEEWADKNSLEIMHDTVVLKETLQALQENQKEENQIDSDQLQLHAAAVYVTPTKEESQKINQLSSNK